MQHRLAPAVPAARAGSPIAPGVACASDGADSAATAIARLSHPRTSLSDVADALHCWCLLHGNRPGLLDLAVADAGGWPAAAAAAFADEREWLARLVSAAGPIPSTANQATSEATIATQRHALETLAVSERPGCALGAAAALVLDWRDLRGWLDTVGDRLGLASPPCALPFAAAETPPIDPALHRAFQFGAGQLLAQHRGLWALIEARTTAREGT